MSYTSFRSTTDKDYKLIKDDKLTRMTNYEMVTNCLTPAYDHQLIRMTDYVAMSYRSTIPLHVGKKNKKRTNCSKDD